MAATQTLSQTRAISQIPKHGVLTVFGYGIQVRVDRGHLFVEDGIGPGRRQFRLSRVRHGLRRLVVIGSDGMVSLAALRWLADQDAAFVMLERDGHVLATTGPVRSSDARLRRAQALAEHSGAALCIARELISRKLVGQERVARDILLDSTTADVIGRLQAELDKAETMDAIRWLESRGAAAYWSMWRDLPICFPKSDLHRVPDHWRAFDTRKSVLSGSQRLATNPVNAILNYVFSVVESESRLAAAALGLDPGLAFIHLDTPARDSLACDLMEPIRPEVEGWLLDWITREPLKREWFFEEPNGTCRLMAPLAIRLAETAPMWARAVAPVAEWVARHLWSRQRKSTYEALPPTRLTQRHKREAKGSSPQASLERAPQNQSVCHGCGKDIQYGRSHCARCRTGPNRANHSSCAHGEGLCAFAGSAHQARRHRTPAPKGASRLGEVKPARLANGKILCGKDSTGACLRLKFHNCISARRIPLSCQPNSFRQTQRASPALAGTGTPGRPFGRRSD